MPPNPSRTARHALGASIITLSLLVIDATTLRAQTAPSGMTKVGEGVYVIVHRDATEEWPQGNTTVVVGESAVLVVDAAYLPSAARADIALIRGVTTKPVRFLVNTHWHYDHNNGNAEYVKAFPGIQIVAHAETRRIMDVNGPGYFAAVVDSGSAWNRTLRELKARLAAGKAESGAALTEAERRALTENIAAREVEQRELRTATYSGPTLTFDRTVVFDLGGRDVQVMNFGRGNTPGDAVVHLPAERIVVAGDLVVAPVPFAFNSYPAQWIVALRSLAGLDGRIIDPGHGPIMRDDAYVRELIALLESAVSQARVLARRRVPLEQAVKQIELEPFRARFARGDRVMNTWFDELVGALPERAYREARGVY